MQLGIGWNKNNDRSKIKNIIALKNALVNPLKTVR
jgi:hypothetical protein